MAEQDFLPLQGFDHVEFYVGNAKQAAYFYSHAFGFTPIAYSGLETGVRDRTSYVLAQGDIRFVFTTALQPDHPVSEHVRLHGDGVKVVALTVDDARRSYEETTRRGAKGVMEPKTIEDEFGRVTLASIATYGETLHTFVERQDYAGPFLPGFKALSTSPEAQTRGAGLKTIDHIVGNVELGKMNEWVDFYGRILGFTQLVHFTDEAISTEYSALMSKVMQNGSGRIKFPINEPAQGKKKSQIEEYLDYYKTPGVQHIALVTDDIVTTVDQLTKQGVEFIPSLSSYYEELEGRVGKIDEPIAEIARLGVLVDRDDEGYLLQIFTKNAQDRPTVFFEVIERNGARGFGEGNFKALFEAIEREQATRGNL